MIPADYFKGGCLRKEGEGREREILRMRLTTRRRSSSTRQPGDHENFGFHGFGLVFTIFNGFSWFMVIKIVWVWQCLWFLVGFN